MGFQVFRNFTILVSFPSMSNTWQRAPENRSRPQHRSSADAVMNHFHNEPGPPKEPAAICTNRYCPCVACVNFGTRHPNVKEEPVTQPAPPTRMSLSPPRLEPEPQLYTSGKEVSPAEQALTDLTALSQTVHERSSRYRKDQKRLRNIPLPKIKPMERPKSNIAGYYGR